MLSKAKWLLNRLKVMGVSEIISRLSDYLKLGRLYFEFRIYRLIRHVDRARPENHSFCRAVESVFLTNDYFLTARFVSAGCGTGRDTYLSGRWRWNASSDIWRRAPDTNRVWAAGFFAFIAYRTGNSVGDVRVAWEPSRLQYLLHEAMVYPAAKNASERKEIADSFARQFHSWIIHNPYLDGIHYISVMECGLRIIAVCHTVDILRQDLSDETWKEFLVLVEGHASLIARRLSVHSSAGNHTLAEAVSLLYAALLLPEMQASKEWRAKAIDIINSEVPRQILPDGSSYEATSWYLLFVADLVALAVELANKHEVKFEPVVYQRLESAGAFIMALGRSPADLIRIGDGDDGFALSPYLKLNWCGSKTDQNQRLLVFPDAGISRIKLQPDSGCEVELYYLHTHAGMPPLFGHSHADCLSLVLRVNGQLLFTDPGTYTYNGDQQWRRYFRSTAAHNTVVVDGEDQFQQLGVFQWQQPYHCSADEPEEIEGLLILSAVHDGYSHKGVYHRRTLLIEENRVLVWDLVTGPDEHDILVRWQLAGAPTHCNDEVVTDVGGYSIHMSWPGQAIKVAGVDVDAGAGWVSSAYGKKKLVYSVLSEQRTILPVELMTVLGFGQSAKSFTVESHVVRVLKKLREKYGV